MGKIIIIDSFVQGRLTNEPEKEEYPKLKKSKIIIALNGGAK